MEIGVTVPQTDIDANPDAIQRYAETVGALGHDHVLAYDHVLGVEPPRPDWDGAYDYRNQFVEPFVLFSHQAAVTTDLGFVTGVLVLPQRDTPLVAKQSATLDVISDGRLTQWVGVRWNRLEYRNIGYDFGSRGDRIEEQVDVLRELWQRELVDYDGTWHDIEGAGINPLPVQWPIPVWMGGGADVVLRRIARQADGLVAPFVPVAEFEGSLRTLRGYLQERGRDADAFPVHVRLASEALGDDDWLVRVDAHADIGVTHVGIQTMDSGFQTVDEHLEVLTDVMAELEDLGFK